MKEKKKSLLPLRSFPFECSESYGVSEEFRELHWHNELEICRIKNGHGIYLINGIEYPFQKDDIFIIHHDDIHLCHDDSSLVMQIIMFDSSLVLGDYSSPLDVEYLHVFQAASTNGRNLLPLCPPDTDQLLCLLDQIESESFAKSFAYELVLKSLLLQFLALANRLYSSSEAESPTGFVNTLNRQHTSQGINKKTALKIKAAVSYIDESFQDKITLAHLSEIAEMSIPHFSATFKLLSGISPIEYTVRKRIVIAKEALRETDTSILLISTNCGFGSLSNFNHLFKLYTGMSPREYRKQS